MGTEPSLTAESVVRFFLNELGLFINYPRAELEPLVTQKEEMSNN